MGRFGVKEVADFTLYNLATGKPELFFNTLKMSNLTSEAQEVVQTGGKGSPELVTWDFGRTATVDIQDALLDPRAMALKSGNALTKGVATLYGREYLTAISSETKTKVTLKETPIEDSVFVYISEDGLQHETEVATPTITGADIEFDNAEVVAGKKVIVYYQYESEATAETILFSSDKYPGYYIAVGDTVIRNEATGVDEPFQIILPKVKISSSMELSLDPENPSVIDFSMKVMKDSSTTDMIRMIKY